MNETIDALVREIRERMKAMSDEERLRLRGEVMDHYCPHCGGPAYHINGFYQQQCQCWNDE